jgi:hypothetical protein
MTHYAASLFSISFKLHIFSPFLFFLLNEKEPKNQENPKLLTHLLTRARRIFGLTRFSCFAGIRFAVPPLIYFIPVSLPRKISKDYSHLGMTKVLLY